MAKLFINQAKHYVQGRPTYPRELFSFIASTTPCHHLAWDVGTGSGQAAVSLANIYKKVIATDTSPKQLELAPNLPNITYRCTSPDMSISELESQVGSQCSADLVTIAQAMHWFDLPAFYKQVKWILKNPNGVIAAWCYTTPEVNPSVDLLFQRFYCIDAEPYWEPPRKLVDLKYETIEFPFEAVDGLENNGPYRFNSEKLMDFEAFLTYLRSWSAYQIAKEKGVELLRDEVVEDFKRAWSEDGKMEKVVTFPIYLRIGKVGSSQIE
ncbi:uncharacterized protein LOC142529727 [Primulina tabacum]|uniref:uncharacterized protein LOC142529727 n=1 Tax=Primulina tabacum TaxID=48773 RepID=UPI003F5A013F